MALAAMGVRTMQPRWWGDDLMEASGELREHLREAGTRVTRRALSRVLRVRPGPNTLLDASGELELEHRPDALPPINSQRLGDQAPSLRSAI
eukprot:3442241-Prymnesium_polylepis.1